MLIDGTDRSNLVSDGLGRITVWALFALIFKRVATFPTFEDDRSILVAEERQIDPIEHGNHWPVDW